MDGAAKPFVSSAAANVGDTSVDIGVRGVGISLEERRRGHDLPRLAIAALRHVLGEPSLLDRVFAVRGKPLDGSDAGALDGSDRHRAGAHRLAVDMDRAGTA